MLDIIEMQKKLQGILPEYRYYHSLGVSYTSASLAMCYGFDVRKAEITGLLHDCAKFLSNDEMLERCEKYGIKIEESERVSPGLLHAKLGAYFTKVEYGCDDDEILSAITYHTTGKPNMTLLEEIVYVADYIEPSRPDLPYINEMRSCAFQNLHKATIYELKSVIEHLSGKNSPIDKRTLETYEFYKNMEKNNDFRKC